MLVSFPEAMEALTSLPVSYLFPCCRRPVPAKSLSNTEPSLLQRDSLPLPAGSASSPSPPRRFRRLRSSINGDKSGESQFFNEDGAVEDMDGYLNYLSLEYDSVWDTKPSWSASSSFFIFPPYPLVLWLMGSMIVCLNPSVISPHQTMG